MRTRLITLLGMLLSLGLGTPLGAQVSFRYDLPGNLESRSNLVAVAPPQFQQVGSSYEIANPIGSLSIAAPVTGTGPFSFQWLFNGTMITGATNASFVIPSFSPGNLGTYQLVASNSAGAATSAVVTVSFDSTHRGLPDAWQMKYFGQLGVDPHADPDGDGVSNLDEFVDGTDPTNPNSVDPRLILADTPGGTIEVSPLKPKYLLNDTVQLTAIANPGNTFIGWLGSVTNTNTTISVVMNASKKIAADFGLPLAQVLDAPSLVWATGGDRGWFGQANISFDGVGAAQSGVAVPGQQSWLQTTLANSNPTEIAFQWAVSSGQSGSGLAFSVNGSNLNSISGGLGEITWHHQVCLIPPGTATLSWVYFQTTPDDDGWIDLDTGWLDQVHVKSLPLTTEVDEVIAWGNDKDGEVDVPPGLTNVVGLAAGQSDSLALKSDGTVVVWGSNAQGETQVPLAVTNITQIASGWFHHLALRRDGKVLAWGDDAYGQIDVPSDLDNVIAVAGGGYNSLALKSNGTIVSWGDNTFGQNNIPSNLTNAIAISAGGEHSLALKSDGTVVGWGDNTFDQSNIPSGLRNVIAIAEGEHFSLALRGDGTLVEWGQESSPLPVGLSNVVAIAAGFDDGMALLSTGTIVTWGDDSYNQADAPLLPPGVGVFSAIAKGSYHGLALLSKGSPLFANEPLNQTVYNGETIILNAAAVGAFPLSYQWRCNGTNIVGATNAWLTLTNVQSINAGIYSVALSNSLGNLARSNATLTVIHSGPIINSEPASLAVVPGQNAVFAAAVVGSLPLSYQWFFEDKILAGATSSMLSLAGVTSDQAGDYQLAVSNSYGAITSGVATLTVVSSASDVVFSNLYLFGTTQNGNMLDGASPYSSLLLDTNGSLYGTTYSGGNGFFGYGTVFKITTGGDVTNVYSFGTLEDSHGNALDGSNPYAGLIVGPDGSLYGTTYYGGAYVNPLVPFSDGFGTVFKLTTNGALTTLYSFGANQDANENALDGANPRAALALGGDGSLYGTASSGGTNLLGTIFKLTANGTFSTVYSFGSVTDIFRTALDGAFPYASLTLARDGNLYGTTSSGGDGESGTVFRITTNGTLTTLYSFGKILDTNGVSLDGDNPQAPLLEGADGNLYGTTTEGGTNDYGFGTVFRIDTNGILTTLYSFGVIQDTNGVALDGASPEGGLVQDRDGYLYGTTSAGGDNDNGTVFQISTTGVFHTLHRFTGGDDGAYPRASLVLSGNTLYGTAGTGGSFGNGTVFSLTLNSTSAPSLMIMTAWPNVVLIWPAGSTGFRLQSSTNLLSPAFWTTSPQSPVVINGLNTITNPISPTQLFFRLSQQ